VDRGEKMGKLRVSKNLVWKCQYAVRVKRKGRARGGIITGIRKEIEKISVDEVKATDGIQDRRLRLERLWKIITIYNNNSLKSKRREIEDMVEDLEKEMLCIGEDFNARIGQEERRIEGKEYKEPWRNSKDDDVNNKGKELLGLVENRGWDITNGNMRGDEKGELTYIGGRGKSMMDYVLVNQKA